MKRMLDMIKRSAIPANMMRTAAKGALSVAAGEMIEILVYLTSHPMFGDEARLTLAGWDEKSARQVMEDPKTSPEVLGYFMDAKNFRLPLLNSLLGNPSVTDKMLVELAMKASTRVLANMLWHSRVLGNATTLHAISMNVHMPEEDGIVVRSALANLGENTDYLIEQAQMDADPDEPQVAEDVLDAMLARYVSEHADEIATDRDKSFEFYVHPAATTQEQEAPAVASVISGAGAVPTLIAKATADPGASTEPGAPDPSIRKKLSAFQKISRLAVGERVQLAMKGSKDERFILIRDGSKVVSAAVLESPKLTDQEIETFASLKNVQENVLRSISTKRKFMRNYVVQRNLVNNPRVPLDVSLPLLKNLMITDLRHMTNNKNVNDTLRKMAVKLYKQRTEKKQE